MGHAILFSMSRGGMLALIITGIVSFVLVARKPVHILIFGVAVLLALRLAGPEVRARFSKTFVDAEERDRSAESRLECWAACWDVMQKEPIFGIGPDQWPIVAGNYGHPGLYAHSLWMQTGAEMGFPGLLCLLTFYGVSLWRLGPLTRRNSPVPDPWLRDVARMVIASLAGFMIAAQFVSISGLELPYYIVMAGAVVLKLSSVPVRVPVGSRGAISIGQVRWSSP
jgi:O-antigen ligase